MLFDDIYRVIGEFGRYQVFLYILLGLVGIPTGWQNMAITFIGADMDSWCKIDALANYSHDIQRHVAVPREKDGEYSRCKYFDLDYFNLTKEEILNWTRSRSETAEIKTCHTFVYDRTVFESTLVSQWDLTCSRKALVSLIQTVYMAGFLTGCISFGQISDMIGRRRALLIALVMEVAFAFAATFCPIYGLYCALRFFVGLSAAGAFTTIFVMTMEIIGARYRMMTGIFCQGWFALGLITYPWMAYALPNHIHVQLLAACLTSPLCLLYFIVPESPRWYVTHGHTEEAEAVVRRIAWKNGKSCPDNLNLEDNNKEELTDNRPSLIDLFRGATIRRITILMWSCWFVASLGYYGLSLGVDFLQGSLFVNLTLSGLVELPSYVIISLIMDRTGRRWPSVISFILCAMFCIACMPLFGVTDLDLLLTSFLMLGKGACSGVFAILYVYAAELFPTVVRNLGVGSSSMCARVSGLLQPQVALLRSIWVPLPFLIYGITSLVAGILVYFLPETLGRRLPETLEDVEERNKRCYSVNAAFQKEELEDNTKKVELPMIKSLK